MKSFHEWNIYFLGWNFRQWKMSRLWAPDPSLFYSWYPNTQQFFFSFFDKSEVLGTESLERALQSLFTVSTLQFWGLSLLHSDETGSTEQMSRHYHSFQVGNKGAVVWKVSWKFDSDEELFCHSSWIFKQLRVNFLFLLTPFISRKEVAWLMASVLL